MKACHAKHSLHSKGDTSSRKEKIASPLGKFYRVEISLNALLKLGDVLSNLDIKSTYFYGIFSVCSSPLFFCLTSQTKIRQGLEMKCRINLLSIVITTCDYIPFFKVRL